MTATPEYPVTLTADLKVGQQFRHGPPGPWIAATHDHITGQAVWVEAKPAPFQPGDRVRYTLPEWAVYHNTATVKYAGEHWLTVQVDDGNYEATWEIHHTERMEDDDQ